MENLVDIGLWGAEIMVVVGILAAIVLPLINSLGDPKVLVKSLVGVAILGTLFLVGWLMSGDEVTPTYISYNVTSAGESKLVGGGLMMMYLLFIIAAAGVVFSEVYKALKS